MQLYVAPVCRFSGLYSVLIISLVYVLAYIEKFKSYIKEKENTNTGFHKYVSE